MTKLASVPPFCAACFQAGSDKLYVDFDAAYDGPVLDLPDGRKQTIDDLVICETCIAEAVDILPKPEDARDERIAELEAQVAALDEERKAKDSMIQRLGISVDELIRYPIQRQGGAVAPAGEVPKEVLTFIALRRADRANKKRSETMKRNNRARASK